MARRLNGATTTGCAMDDEGQVDGWPREGLCLAVHDGRARPAWKTRNGRILVYGETRGAARGLGKHERIEPMPSDAELAARLQKEWATAAPSQRDGLLLALDEMEARRMAPDSFVKMVSDLRRAAADGHSALGPCASVGREFYPNLFPPLVDDAVRVLWDSRWYEAVCLPSRTCKRANKSCGGEVACDASVVAGRDRLHVRYVEDGEKDDLEWPDPDSEAFLLAPLAMFSKPKLRRRCTPKTPQLWQRDWRPILAKDRNGAFEEPFSWVCTAFAARRSDTPPRLPATPPRVRTVAPLERPAFRDALLTASPRATATSPLASKSPTKCKLSPEQDRRSDVVDKILRCCDALKRLARPLAALVDDFAAAPRDDWVFALPRDDDGDDWPFDFVRDDARPVEMLFDFASALSTTLDALDGDVDDCYKRRRSDARDLLAEDDASPPSARPALQAHRVLFVSSLMDEEDVEDDDGWSSPDEHPSDSVDVSPLAPLARQIARHWGPDTVHFPLGPAPALAAGAPCFATLPRSRVSEPHKGWICRSRRAARAHIKRKQALEDGDDDDDDDMVTHAESHNVTASTIQAQPLKYRPPGAAARAALCGDGVELVIETVAPEIAASLAGGVGADASRRVEVVDIEQGPMAGEKGVVAVADIDKKAVIPYAGVVVTDDEIGQFVMRRPRAAARWLMYRYEFAPQISVLPFLGSPAFCPAPFINCARGPHPNEARAWSAQRERAVEQRRRSSSRETTFKPRRWRAWGSQYIGLRIRRTVIGNAASELAYADGTVVAWLDANESDFVDDAGNDAALWRVKYDDDGPLGGDDEDLELDELLTSAKAPALERLASDDANALKANCHFSEVTGDGGAVMGVYIVAQRKISPGEPLLVTYGREFWNGWIQRRARLDDLDNAADDLAAAALDLARAVETLRRVAAPQRAQPRSAPRRKPRSRHDAWRDLVGVPFEAGRSLRGERHKKAVVAGLVVEQPKSHDSPEFRPGDRVEAYWRGAAPSFPATVRTVHGDKLDIDYDDGTAEDNVPLDRVLARTPAKAWRDRDAALPVGVWLRKHESDQDDDERPKKAPRTRKREGVAIAADAEAFDVMGDDGLLEMRQKSRDWEPLFVVRFADDDEQRVMGLDQLRYLSPHFLDLETLQPVVLPDLADLALLLPAEDRDASAVSSLVHSLFLPPSSQIDVSRVLVDAGLRPRPS